MIKKICPICDMEMKVPHYCRYCRQFVKQPLIRDVTYKLNESHSQKTKQHDYNPTMRTLMHNKDHHPVSTSLGREPSRQRKKKSLAPLLIMAIPLVFALAFLYLRPVRTIEVVNETLEYGNIGLGSYEGESEDEYDDRYSDEAIQLDARLVRSLGIHCSLSEHFTITLAEIEQEMGDLIVGLGISAEGIYEEGTVDNLIYSSGETWYSFAREYRTAGESDQECIVIDCDTATGELHAIYIVLEDSETFFGAVHNIFRILEEHEEVGEPFFDADITETNIKESLEEYPFYATEWEDIYVDVMYHEGIYGCKIYK